MKTENFEKELKIEKRNIATSRMWYYLFQRYSLNIWIAGDLCGTIFLWNDALVCLRTLKASEDIKVNVLHHMRERTCRSFFQIVATLLWSALWIKIFWIFCTSSLFVLWNVLFFCPTAKIVWNYQILRLGAERLIISWNVEGSSSLSSWMTNLWRVQYEKVKGIFVNSYPGVYLQIIWRTVIISAFLL